MAKVDNEEMLRLVGVIDEEGTHLTRSEIDFIAGIIDGKQKTFSDKEAKRINKIHYKRVVNGKPELD